MKYTKSFLAEALGVVDAVLPQPAMATLASNDPSARAAIFPLICQTPFLWIRFHIKSSQVQSVNR
jgi:hypothetical protein